MPDRQKGADVDMWSPVPGAAPGSRTARPWPASRRPAAASLRQARYGQWVVWTFVVPPFGLLAFFVIWPILYLGYLSLLKWDGLGPRLFVGLANYASVLNDERFWLSIRHNLAWSFAALIVPPVIGLTLAVLLTRSRAPGRPLFQIIFFLPQMVSSAIMAVIWRWIYYPSGPANALLRAVGLGMWQPQWLADSTLALPALFVPYAWVANGFSLLIFQAAIQSIDESLFEAARIDGASWWDEVRYVLLPGIRQALITVLIVTAIWSFQIFDLIYLTTKGGPGDSTYVLAIGIYTHTFAYRRVGTGAALAMILLVIVVLLSIVIVLRSRKESAA